MPIEYTRSNIYCCTCEHNMVFDVVLQRQSIVQYKQHQRAATANIERHGPSVILVPLQNIPAGCISHSPFHINIQLHIHIQMLYLRWMSSHEKRMNIRCAEGFIEFHCVEYFFFASARSKCKPCPYTLYMRIHLMRQSHLQTWMDIVSE